MSLFIQKAIDDLAANEKLLTELRAQMTKLNDNVRACRTLLSETLGPDLLPESGKHFKASNGAIVFLYKRKMITPPHPVTLSITVYQQGEDLNVKKL